MPTLNTRDYLLRLLGTPQIEGAEGVLGGGVVQRHRIALLGLLALAPRGLLPRDRLLALLWPEASTESARNLLNAAVHAVRRSLGEELLITQGSGLRLDTARIRIDVLDFENALKNSHIRQAIDLYTGPFLDGLALPDGVEFERWQDRERERLERLYHQALEQQAESVAQEQGPAAAADWWRRRLACTPTDGRIVLRLMQILVAAGDRAGAMHAASNHARLLEEEFGAPPDPSVAQLAEDVHRGSPGIAMSSPVTPGTPKRHAAKPPTLQSDDDSLVVRSEGVQRRFTRRFGRRTTIVALSAVFVAAGMFAAFAVLRPQPSVSVDENVIFVAPFQITAPGDALSPLREGVVDMLSAQLTGEGLPRAIDSRATISAWQRAVREKGADHLTEAQSIALAEQFGAGQLLLGELTATPSGMYANARILSVPDGRVLARHDESARDNELELINRLVSRLLAIRAGEAETRLRTLSESQDATRAYLAAMEAHRSGRYQEAVELFGRALDFDPDFAIAALRRSDSADLTPSAVNILDANLTAWRLRDNLSRRDRAILQTSWGIGPNYPMPSTTIEQIGALEQSADVNPDRPEAWLRLGSFYLIYGASASIVTPLDRAVAAIDRAIELDSSFTPALQLRLWAALEQHDTASIRRIGTLYNRAQHDAPLSTVHQWLVARSLGDSVSWRALSKQLHDAADLAELLVMTARSAVEGFSLAQADSAVLNAVSLEREPVRRMQLSLRGAVITALRGRTTAAMSLLDSLVSPGNLEASAYVIALALADSGYEAAAGRAVDVLDTFAASTRGAGGRANALCYAELWRSLQGKADGAPGVAEEIRQLVRDFDPAPFPRVGRMDVCPLLLEAATELAGSPTSQTAALDRLDARMQQGIGLELPGNIANLIVARWRERQGDLHSALAAVRRRLGGVQNPHFTLVQPALLREEGRLAALTGDTLAAIRAYRHYLTLRDSPDDGPMRREVLRVQTHLAEIERSLRLSERRPSSP